MPNTKQYQIVPIFNEIHSIDYNIDKQIPKLLHNASVKRTLNSWIEGSLVDGVGQVWIIEDFLANIWRTDSSTASFFVDTMSSSDKSNFNGDMCIKYSAVIYRLSEIIQSPTSHKRREYLRVSEDIGRAVRDSSPVEIIRLRYREFIEETKKKLKYQRIKKYNLFLDELTGLPLDISSSEFHHIRRQSIAPAWISFIWNGLILNRDTHDIITMSNISDEYDLRDICIDKGWSIDWFERYGVDLKLIT